MSDERIHTSRHGWSAIRGNFAVIALAVIAGCSPATPASSLPASVPPTSAPSSSVIPTPASSPSAAASASPAANASVDPAALNVVRGWLDAQNAGDLAKAATYFAPGARIGPDALVTTHSVADIVAILEPLAVCRHDIVGVRPVAGGIVVAVELSGSKCTFLEVGETTHEIEIPVQIEDGKIICTCPPGVSWDSRRSAGLTA